MSDLPIYPTADQIARAVVTAARATGDNPILCVMRQAGLRCRPYAFEALRVSFPDARKEGLARAVGYSSNAAASTALKGCRGSQWWSETIVDDVIGAIVAPHYGEQAA